MKPETVSVSSAAERSEEAQSMFDRAAAGEHVDLVALSGMMLCVLGAPKHVVCDDKLAEAWAIYGKRRRVKANELITGQMQAGGLLLEPAPGTGGDYGMAPGLALAMAGRCRPAYLVLTGIAGRQVRSPRFFALGDEEVPVRGIVMENPAAVPDGVADPGYLKTLGPLGWLYTYTLLSPANAAGVLADWLVRPAMPGGGDAGVPYRTASLYRHHPDPAALGGRIVCEGNGETAKLFLPTGSGEVGVAAEVGLEELRRNVAGLLDMGTA